MIVWLLLICTSGSFCLRILTTFVFDDPDCWIESSMESSDFGLETFGSDVVKGELVPAIEILPSMLPMFKKILFL